jgi:phosphotransferase system HPr (HPr) family protein
VQVSESFDATCAAKLVQTASKYKSHISLVVAEKTANAKSIMGIISLELGGGTKVKIAASGEDAEAAVPELKMILGGN